jgi:hypothetical protein
MRDEYRESHPDCAWCGEAVASQLHEIARGPARDAALSVPAAWLHLCETCHPLMDRLPVAAQLAIKRISDPTHYDRRAVNRLRGRDENAITDADVTEWLLRFQMVESRG